MSQPTTVKRYGFTYTHCYCEENIYQLVMTLTQENDAQTNSPQKQPALSPISVMPASDLASTVDESLSKDSPSTDKTQNICSDFFVVIISNDSKSIPIWNFQEESDPPTLWDYHVILLQKKESNVVVYDFDSRLPHLPVSFELYNEKILREESPEWNPRFCRQFRVVQASEYLREFSSDRSHMKKNGVWLMSPPDYPIIQNGKTKTNLMSDFVDMKAKGFGKVFDHASFTCFVEKLEKQKN